MAFDRIRGVITRAEDGLLQAILNSFVGDTTTSPTGGILQLGRGDFYGNLVIDSDATHIEGEGNGTVIHGSITVRADDCSLSRLTVRGLGQPYAVKLYRSGGSVSRCRIDHCFIGPTFEGATDGPVAVAGVGGHGLWLDGSIDCDFVNCTIPFSPGSNVFVDTTDTLGTNINRLQSCTMNGAGRYGVEAIGGGVIALQVYGGNIESNSLGAVLASSISGLDLIGIDFENSGPAKVVTDLINVSGSQWVTLERCLFFDGHAATRAFVIATSSGVRVAQNRLSGFNGGVIGVLDQATTGIIEPNNLMIDGLDRILSHRGRMVFA